METSTTPSLPLLGALLSGEFDNYQQAFAEPVWYVRLKLWHRQVRLFESDSLTFFIEQVSVASGNPPYRQRLLRLQSLDGELKGRYYGLQQPLRFQGGALDPRRLESLSAEDIVELNSCYVQIYPIASGFTARMPPDTLCSFEYQGKTSYVSLGFDVVKDSPTGEIQFSMYDRGVEPNTGSIAWGPLMGPFRFVKQKTFNVA